MKAEGVNVYLTIDREQEGWDGHVGFVPNYVKELGFDTDTFADTRRTDHGALSRHMLEQLAALRRIDAERLYVRGLFPDIRDHAYLKRQEPSVYRRRYRPCAPPFRDQLRAG